MWADRVVFEPEYNHIRNFDQIRNVRPTRNITSAHARSHNYHYRSQSSNHGGHSRPSSGHPHGRSAGSSAHTAHTGERVTYTGAGAGAVVGGERVTYTGAANYNTYRNENDPQQAAQHHPNHTTRPTTPNSTTNNATAAGNSTAAVPWWERLTTTKTGNLRADCHNLKSVREDMDLLTREERMRHRSSTNLHENAPRIEYVSPRTELWTNPGRVRVGVNRPKSAHYHADRRR
ncbi:unnamed protein product [Amoebophrya sp. A120]|nr:unnamed protein product [Amoebophrya sp. A120]|eukprot:GSA120T00008653001.1